MLVTGDVVTNGNGNGNGSPNGHSENGNGNGWTMVDQTRPLDRI